MGSGKSSVGRELPALLSLPGGHFDFIDLDDFIVESEGMSVNGIFERYGESGFRSIETRCLETLLERYEGKNLVLALGGGTAVFNSELVHSRTRCIYLSASVDTLVSRLSSDTSRPLLSEAASRTAQAYVSSSTPGMSSPPQDKDDSLHGHTGLCEKSSTCVAQKRPENLLRDRIERLYASREATYRSVAHHTVATDGLSVATIAALIAGLF